MIQIHLLTKQTEFKNKLVVLGGRMKERDIREFGMDMYARLYLKWITNRALLQSTGNSAQCYVAARMGGEFGGRMDYISFFCLPKTTTTLLIGYTPIQNKKVKKKKRLGQILSYSTLIFYFIIINELKIIFLYFCFLYQRLSSP